MNQNFNSDDENEDFAMTEKTGLQPKPEALSAAGGRWVSRQEDPEDPFEDEGDDDEPNCLFDKR